MMMVILKEPKKMKILLMVRIERERGGGKKDWPRAKRDLRL